MRVLARRAFGDATAFLRHSRRLGWADLAVVGTLGGVAYAVSRLAQGAALPMRQAVEIDLSLSALPGYTVLSLMRGLAALALSLLFTLGYGYWAARDALAEKVLVPLLDVLQSVPVLGFMPGLVLSLVALFPGSNIGIEAAAIVMIFTGQAWNMTFSFYRSVRNVPPVQLEVARHYHFGWWQRFKWVELPASVIGLTWNAMMSMAGGWFFLMVSEAFVLGSSDFRLPGLGAYMSVAVAAGDGRAMVAAVVAMVVMIVTLDQLLWRPVVVWAQKFRQDEGQAGEAARSWFLDVLRRSRLVRLLRSWRRRAAGSLAPAPHPPSPPGRVAGLLARALPVLLFGGLVVLLGLGRWSCSTCCATCPGRPGAPRCWRPGPRWRASSPRWRSARSGRCRPAWPSAFRRASPARCSRWCRWWPPSPPPCSSRRWWRCWPSSASGSPAAAWC